jgi:Zinc-binding loop region of homing endonuclease
MANNQSNILVNARINLFNRLSRGNFAAGETWRTRLTEYKNFCENQFTQMQGTINTLRNNVVANLQAQVAALQNPNPAQRPQTSDTVIGERQGFLLDQSTSAYLDRQHQYGRCTAAQAQNILASKGFTNNGIGCRLSTNAPHRDENGYVKINLRNTPGLGFQIFIHMLALIAAGRKDELLACQDPEHPLQLECSHLCHNNVCFEASHIIVEPHADNVARQTCAGTYIIRHGAMTFHPCPHGNMWAKKHCILPVLALGNGYHRSAQLPPQ